MASPRDVTRVLRIVNRLRAISAKHATLEGESYRLLSEARQILTDADARELRLDPSKRKPASREQRRAAHARRNAR